MIVDYCPSTGLSLRDANDFKRFSLHINGAEPLPVLDGIAFADDHHALIRIDLVPTLLGAQRTKEWLTGFEAMVSYAAGKGWVDAPTASILAHITRS